MWKGTSQCLWVNEHYSVSSTTGWLHPCPAEAGLKHVRCSSLCSFLPFSKCPSRILIQVTGVCEELYCQKHLKKILKKEKGKKKGGGVWHEKSNVLCSEQRLIKTEYVVVLNQPRGDIEKNTLDALNSSGNARHSLTPQRRAGQRSGKPCPGTSWQQYHSLDCTFMTQG